MNNNNFDKDNNIDLKNLNNTTDCNNIDVDKNIDYDQLSLQLHKQNAGKISIVSKVTLKDKRDLSLAYSPGVGAVSLAISMGKDILSQSKLARDYTLKNNTIAIVSDGSAVLGFGNLGDYAAIPVMEGKAAILKEFANVDAFPICIKDQDTETIIQTVKNISAVFGGINLEDISAPKCFEIEERLRNELNIPVMHDDQWGAATATLSAVINALKLTKKEKQNVIVVLSGVGAAGVATAKLLLRYGINNLILIDSNGIINSDRKDLNKQKLELLNRTNIKTMTGDLTKALSGADIFIGLSKPNVLTQDMIRQMSINPVIFALANPNPEIMPQDAIDAGAFIIGTGRSDFPNQINNSLIFPGFWRGVLDMQYSNKYKKIEEETFVKIAIAIANMIDDKDLNVNNILPDMFDKNLVTVVSDCIKNI